MKCTVAERRLAVKSARRRHVSVNFTLVAADRHGRVLGVKTGAQNGQQGTASKTAWIAEQGGRTQ